MEGGLRSTVEAFARELVPGKVVLELQRDGTFSYRRCYLNEQLRCFSVQTVSSGGVTRQPLEWHPLECMPKVRPGYDLTDNSHVPLSLPAEALAAVVVMDGRPTNLIFASPLERDEFVACMLALRERCTGTGPCGRQLERRAERTSRAASGSPSDGHSRGVGSGSRRSRRERSLTESTVRTASSSPG